MPSVQKKTGPVKKDVEEEVDENGEAKSDEEVKPAKRKRASKVEKEDLENADAQPAIQGSKSKKKEIKQEQEPVANGAIKEEELAEEESKPAKKKQKSTNAAKTNGTGIKPQKQKNAKPQKKAPKASTQDEDTGRRRSTRKSGGET